jgi:hypothetical protein
MVRKITIVILFLLAIMVNFNERFNSEIIAPIGALIMNLSIEHEEEKLKKYGILINLPKSKWVYTVSDYAHEFIIHFSRNKAKIDNRYIEVKADLYLYKDPLTKQEFNKVIDAYLKNCTSTKHQELKKDNQLYILRYCNNKEINFKEVLITQNNRQIIIKYYPFFEEEKSREILNKFLRGISFPDLR